ncbi:tetratricopeptide repeat protein [Aquincola sp. J276]|uniref:ATP-binding protein n=1 Tax=Aquincola sp. J276 TaxID=2898432 RepID=UPI002151B6FA|nr:tetratricopeptide repeat protein [Aquincola sp. J276]MCR5863843.1 tetratricopeptide repeat protein [Aquincola sp. J276]
MNMPAAERPASRHLLGRFELRLQERLLLDDGRPLPLGSRAFDLLAALVAGRGRMLSKDELLDTVWPGLVVEENNLQVQVSKLRRLLGRDAIATVAGRGYQLTLPLRPAPTDEATPQPDTPAAAAPVASLPPERSPFIGRQKELSHCLRLMADSRLLCIVAIGGCGKTRLALALARRLAPATPDGVWFIDLAPLHEAGGVPLAIGAALRVYEQPGTPMIDAVAGAIGQRQMLLVLDNCEHMVAAVAEMADQLLSRCPRLQILATSRVALCHPLERVYALAPLEVPGPGERGVATGFDAVRLFIDRLQWADPGYAPDADELAAVVDICRRLDGIPLALELAAARRKVLSVQEIRARLDDRFRLLTDLPRHQTLRATIQWSYDQMDPVLQRRFRALAVVAGRWTLHTAAALAGEPGDGELDMLEAMSRLVDQSLVTVQAGPGGETRYGFLETVRVFARDRLRDAGEEAAARSRHLAHYVALVEAGHHRMQGPGQRDWLLQLDLERENILLAHAWCDSVVDGAHPGLVLTAALRGYWRMRGLLGTGYRLACQAVARASHAPAGTVHARALVAAGEAAYFLGRHDEALPLLARALAMARTLDDAPLQASAMMSLGFACLGLGRTDEAHGHAAAALALAGQAQDARLLDTALRARGVVHLADAAPARAGPLFEQALARSRERQTPAEVAINLVNVAWVAVLQGDAPRARETLAEAIDVATDIGHEGIAQMTLDAFAGLCAATGDWDDAARFHGAAQAGIEVTRQQRQPAVRTCVAPLVAATTQALGATRFAALQAEGRQLVLADAVREARRQLCMSPLALVAALPARGRPAAAGPLQPPVPSPGSPSWISPASATPDSSGGTP